MFGVNNYDIIADLYDTYVPVTNDIDFFVSEACKAKGEVLELMSGTGRVSIPMLEAGVRLACVDSSVKSNAILKRKLRKKGLKADVYTMDICEFELHQQFSIAVIPFSSFAHITSPSKQRQALSRVYQHLQPGGTFICTLNNPTLRGNSVDSQLHLAYTYPLPDHGKLLLWILEQFDPEDEQVVQAFEFFERYTARGRLIFKRLMELHFRLIPKDQFEDLLTGLGFSIQRLYGDYDYHEFDSHSSQYMIWEAQKPIN
jgi:SAM-dependent methyltransferase